MQPFVNENPIFIKNRRESVNFQAGFKCVFSADAGKKYLLRITGATLYSIWLNGEFVFYGPARTPHGYLNMTRLNSMRPRAKTRSVYSLPATTARHFTR